MRILVNDKHYDVSEGITVAALLKKLGYGQNGIAVALDDTVLSRSLWEKQALTEGTSLIVIQAVSGG